MTAPTERDPHAMPSCPRCTLNDRIYMLEPPTQRGNEQVAASPWPFECARCVLLFTGTDAEWSRMAPDRAKYRESLEPRAMPGGVR
jgi:hypothetical protein